MDNDPIEYTKALKYLPDFMKDFHDQKDIFKTIQELYSNNESLKKLPNSWPDNHIYVIDYFLWFMGQHGYKLQKDRSKVGFYDLQSTLEKFKQNRVESFAKILKQAESNDTANG